MYFINFFIYLFIFFFTRYRSKSRKLNLRSSLSGNNNSDIKTDKSVNGSNKTFKQNDDLSYHSIKSHDNSHRESNYF